MYRNTAKVNHKKKRAGHASYKLFVFWMFFFKFDGKYA